MSALREERPCRDDCLHMVHLWCEIDENDEPISPVYRCPGRAASERNNP